MSKDLQHTILELENEIIRKKREEKQQREETVNGQVQLEDLEQKLDRIKHSEEDAELLALQTSLDSKQNKLKNLRSLIEELEDKVNISQRRKSMTRAKKVVNDIGDAIDNISMPRRPVSNKPVSRTHIYNHSIMEEEKVPLCIKIEEIFVY